MFGHLAASSKLLSDHQLLLGLSVIPWPDKQPGTSLPSSSMHYQTAENMADHVLDDIIILSCAVTI